MDEVYDVLNELEELEWMTLGDMVYEVDEDVSDDSIQDAVNEWIRLGVVQFDEVERRVRISPGKRL